MKATLSGVTSLVLLDSLALAAFAVAMLVTGGAVLDAAALAGVMFGSAVIVAAGFVIVLWTTGDSAPARHTLAILLGSIATSLVLLGGCAITRSPAGLVFLWWSGLVIPAAAWTFRSAPRVSRADRSEVLAIAAIAVVVAIWCHRTAGLLPTLQATGISTSWSDYAIHGTELAQFGDPHVASLSSFLLSGQPLVVYHYASYMIPAAAAGVVDLPPWGMAASLLLPLGILLAALGVHALARTLATPGLALLAPIALLLVPDPSTFGLKNGFFGFHWLLFTAPGSGYGLAAAFTALALVAIWRGDKRPACFWLAVVVTLAIFEFRAQIFVLFVPALAMTLLCESALARRHARGLAVGALVATVAVAVCFAVPPARDAWLRFSVFPEFLSVVHTGMSPTAYDGVYRTLEERQGPAVASAIGFLMLMPLVLGVLIVALPAALAAAIRRRGWQPLDTLPIWCLLAWLGLVLVAPAPGRGGPTEYQHRPFVLVYATGLVWTLLFMDRALRGVGTAPAYARLAVPALVVAAAGVGAATGIADRARPRFAWGARHFETRVEPGVIDAASFVRAHAVAGDTFALTPTEPAAMLADEATRLSALSGVPAYVARAGMQRLNGLERSAIVDRRLAELTLVETTTDAGAALLTLRRAGVDFLVTLGGHCPRFDPACSRAAFRTKDAVVHRVAAE
jgi:hypothetical protein